MHYVLVNSSNAHNNREIENFTMFQKGTKSSNQLVNNVFFPYPCVGFSQMSYFMDPKTSAIWARGLELLWQAALQGEASAMFGLAELFAVEQDLHNALKWYRRCPAFSVKLFFSTKKWRTFSKKQRQQVIACQKRQNLILKKSPQTTFFVPKELSVFDLSK